MLNTLPPSVAPALPGSPILRRRWGGQPSNRNALNHGLYTLKNPTPFTMISIPRRQRQGCLLQKCQVAEKMNCSSLFCPQKQTSSPRSTRQRSPRNTRRVQGEGDTVHRPSSTVHRHPLTVPRLSGAPSRCPSGKNDLFRFVLTNRFNFPRSPGRFAPPCSSSSRAIRCSAVASVKKTQELRR